MILNVTCLKNQKQKGYKEWGKAIKGEGNSILRLKFLSRNFSTMPN